jgi:hypothetical protein
MPRSSDPLAALIIDNEALGEIESTLGPKLDFRLKKALSGLLRLPSPAPAPPSLALLAACSPLVTLLVPAKFVPFLIMDLLSMLDTWATLVAKVLEFGEGGVPWLDLGRSTAWVGVVVMLL